MRSLRVFTTLANQKLVVLLIPVLSPLCLDNFYFHSFQGGTKGKMLKKQCIVLAIFAAFFLWSPLGNYENKSCLNELKFFEISGNPKSSIC